MQLTLEFENPVINIETSTPDLVEIHADATITIVLSSGVNMRIIPVDNYLKGDGTDTYPMTNIPFIDSEIVFVGGAVQMRGTDYTITGSQIKFNTIVPVDMPIWIHGWRI